MPPPEPSPLSYWHRHPTATAILTRMWKTGKTSNEITKTLNDRFGPITRNAVMGKVDRLGLMGYHAMPRRHDKPKPKAKPKPHPPCKRLHIREAIIEEPPLPPPLASPVSLWEVATGQCRWPVGEASEMMFCGLPLLPDARYSFCPEHHALAITGQWRSSNYAAPLKRLIR